MRVISGLRDSPSPPQRALTWSLATVSVPRAEVKFWRALKDVREAIAGKTSINSKQRSLSHDMASASIAGGGVCGSAER